jgi:tRNA1(Val) A37 N6-methylase TrmN6
VPPSTRSSGAASAEPTGAGGIVRAARGRPPGWTAPGPPPHPPAAAHAIGPRAGEDLCHLCGDWRILQRLDGHRWSLDDLVTAWLATTVAHAPTRILDLGCGIGSVLLMLAWRFPAARVVGVEAQAVSVDLARRSIAWNGCDDRCEVRRGDLRDPSVIAGEPAFDVVTGTPPYLVPGTGRTSPRPQKTPCTFELRGGIEEYARAAARALAPGGAFVVCEQAAQGARTHAAAAAAGLAVCVSLPVVPRQGKPPLFAVHALRRAPATAEGTLPALVVRDGRGVRTDAFRVVRSAMGLPP